MIKQNIKFCLYSLFLTNCSGHVHLAHSPYRNDQVSGEIIRPIQTLDIRHVVRPKDISSILRFNEERTTSLTLVVMDRECGNDYYLWLQSNANRIVNSDMRSGAIIHEIQHEDGNEFVVIVDEDQMLRWRIDSGKFSLSRSRLILFGPRAYRFKQTLKPLFRRRKVIVPNKGCNMNFETIINQAIDS